ncbi:hypothetical protein HAX54_019276 [Datura stramonium]|uniref:Uncharacterized protein n=1 Tax=Datura stramonium TaxID=4076 RepID=A0ABS8S1V3_DATST|nr:hypothetical protein [Datura stramonium]
MEEAAEGFLMDLISSNVVMVSKREYNGKVKYCQQIFEESSKLENLRIFTGIVNKIDVLLQRSPNLQEVKIRFSAKEYSAESFCPKWESLTQLRILHLFIPSSLVVSELHFPSIKELVLEGTHIESTISFIAGLPSLEHLQLRSPDFFQSKEWCLGDITFHKLKVLKLVELDISRWDASENRLSPA